MNQPNDPKNTNSNNADDPFGGMDMMAWMESLAKRQGANAEELTTAANIDIPMPPADSVIDEPGYTPGYEVSKPKNAEAAPTPAPVPAAPTPPAPVATPAPTAAAATVDPNDPFGGMDMMAWMESLAKRQGASSEELTTAANIDIPLPPADSVIDEPGYTPGYEVSKPKNADVPPLQSQAVPMATPAPEPVPEPTPAAATVDPNDPFGGMDMMAWMESLAKRQGASSEELTTAANIDVPMPPADSVIDEPGYTPGYEVSKPKNAEVPPPPVQSQAVPAAIPAPEAVPEPMPAAASIDPSDPFGGMDMMAWMESLAKRQGAKSDELMTAANIDIPLPPPGTIIDEPGYSDYSPFGTTAPVSEAIDTPTMSSAEAAALLGLSDKAAEPNPLSNMDPLAWLESLAAPEVSGNTDFASFTAPSPETSEAMEAASALSWLEQLASEAQGYPYPTSNETRSAEADLSQAWVDATPAPADELGGLSDDMNELQRWLAAQASSLAEVHDLGEDPALSPVNGENDEVEAFASADLDDAAPGAIPDWLREHMPNTSGVPSSSQITSAPLSEIFNEPSIPADLPAWLMENVSAPVSDPLGLDAATYRSDLSPAVIEPEIQISSGDDYMAPEVPIVTQPISANDMSDPWVEAFEYEESRRQAGEEDDLPDWYTDALARSGEPGYATTSDSSSTVPTLEADGQASVLAPNDYPAWLTDLTVDSEEASSAADLRTIPTSADEIKTGELPSWLVEALPDSSGLDFGNTAFDSTQFEPESAFDMADLPDWLREAEPPAAEPLPINSPEPVAVAPTPTPSYEPEPIALPNVEPEPVVAAQPPPKITAPDVRDFWGAAASIAEAMPAPKPPPAPTPVPVAPPVPVPPAPVSIDHAQKLQQARTLVAQGQYQQSLTHYQDLIDNHAALDHVIGDMQTIVAAQPTDPSARRLLGDAHLRKGNLQDALDTYRKALDQL